MEEHRSLKKLHEQYIEGTEPKEYVKNFTVLLSQVQNKVRKAISAKHSRVYMTSKVLKHIYDRHCHEKKQDYIYNFLLTSLYLLIENPDIVRENKDSKKKRSEIVFIKEIAGERYGCPIEKELYRKGKKMIERLCIVSAFKMKKKGRYLENTKILYQKR